DLIRRGRAELMAVNDQEVESLDPPLDHLRQPVPQVPPVGVPPDGRHRSDRLQLGKQVGRPDVSRVDDVVNLFENIEDFRSQEAMGVADDAQAHYWPQRLLISALISS